MQLYMCKDINWPLECVGCRTAAVFWRFCAEESRDSPGSGSWTGPPRPVHKSGPDSESLQTAARKPFSATGSSLRREALGTVDEPENRRLISVRPIDPRPPRTDPKRCPPLVELHRRNPAPWSPTLLRCCCSRRLWARLRRRWTWTGVSVGLVCRLEKETRSFGVRSATCFCDLTKPSPRQQRNKRSWNHH